MRKKVLSWILTVAMTLSLFTAIPITASAAVNSCRIVETEVQYATLDEALSAATSEQTIQLLTDVTHNTIIMANSKSFVLDVNGHSLTVSVDNQICLYASPGFNLSVTDSGSGGSLILEASGGTGLCGIYANGAGSEITIDVSTSVDITGDSCYGVYAYNGGLVSVTGDVSVTGTNSKGAYAENGSTIDITGDIITSAVSGTIGLEMRYGGHAEIDGDITAETGMYISNIDNYGTNIDTYLTPVVNLTGNIIASGYAVNASGDADITIEGNVTGCVYMFNTSADSTIDITGDIDYYYGPGVYNGTGTVIVNGNITSADGYGVVSDSNFTLNGNITAKHGVHSSAPSGNIIINGDISSDGGFGVYVYNGAVVTVNGTISGASPYIRLDYVDYTEGSGTVDGDYMVYSCYTNNNPTYVHTVYVLLPQPVCEVDGVQYATLDEGLVAAAVDEDTIKLLTDIEYAGELRLIADTWINLNGFSIDVVNDSGIALYADGHDLDISGTGALNVTGSTFGVFIRSGASVEVTNATATGVAGKAVYALDPNCSVTVFGDATANAQQGTAVYAEGSGSSSATIHGDVYAQGTGGIGVCAVSESAIMVMGRIYATNYLQVGALIKEEGDYTTLENNYYIYTDDTATVRARQEVCALNGTPYLFLEEALADAESGDTITLLADIRYVNDIVLTDTDLHFDLDTYKLEVGRTGAEGSLKVDGGTLTIDDTNGGELNIVTGYVGVKAINGGTATVSSILDPTTSNSLNGYGIIGENGGSVTVTGDIKVLSYIGEGLHLSSGSSAHVLGDIYSLNGITIQGDGTVATIEGNISSSSGNGVQIGSSGTAVIHGNVQSETRGIVGGSGGGSVHVMGNVTANRWEGIYAYSDADIVVDGDVISPYGFYAWGEGTTVLIKQNTTTTDPAYWGAYAFNGAEIMVDGTITAADPANYAKVGDVVMTEDSFTINGNGYYLYTDSTSLVMVKINTCLLDGCSTSLEDGGFTQYSVIDGETYYHVTNAAQLAHINDHLDLNYIQMNDIDLTGIDWTPIGSRFYPGFELGFDGTYDGNGYLINNLIIGSSSTPKNGGDQTQAGLFGAIKYNAILKNISVTVDIHTDGVTNVGGLVGYSESDGTVSNCSVGGSILIKGEDTNEVGGLIGYVSNTSISECSSNVTITVEDYANKVGGLIGSHGRYSYNKLGNISNSIFTGAVNGGNSSYTGGITGTSYGNVFIINSINAGSVTAVRGNVGGIAGKIHNNIANCYNVGSVSNSGNSSNKVGGIVGFIDSGYVKNCYNSGTVSNPGGAIAGALVADLSSYDTAGNLYSDITVNPSMDPINIINGTSYYLYNLTTEEMKGAAPSQVLEYGEGLNASGIVSALNGWIDEFDYSEADIVFARWDMDSSVNSGYPYLVGVPMENNAELDSLSITEGTLSPSFSKDIDVYEANVPNSTDELSVTAIARSENASISINGETVSTSIVQLAVGNNTIEIIVTAENGVTTNKYTVNITRAAASSSGGGSSAPTGQQITVSTPDGGTVVTGTLTESGNTEQITIRGTQFRTLANANKGAMIPAPSATVTFDAKAMDAINGASSTGDVVLTIEKLDQSTLTPEQQKRVGDRPVYDFTLTKGGQQITHFNGGHAKISIPYTLADGENPHQVVIYYLTSDGTLKPVRGHYDANSKCVIFETTHFSAYTVGYNPVSFNDVAAGAWYKDAIDFIAAREITSGTGDGAFSPEIKLTRGQFIVLLMNAYGVSPDVAMEGTTNFTDAGSNYYTNYLLAAKSLGIVNGVGNNMFAPEQAITRQEMFVMLYNALSVLGEVPAASGTKLLSDFEDASQIASWAQEAMDALVKGGVISGSNGMLHPGASTTRAEMSQMLYNLLSK